MKIPSENYQFSNEPSILVVTGIREALIYYAREGEVDRLSEIMAEKPEDPGKPGVFITGGKNMIHHGASLEDKQRKIRDKAIKNFLSELKKDLKEIPDIDKIKSLYLFTPEPFEGSVLEEIPAKLKKKIENTFYGNYTNKHPIDLVKKITTVKNKKKEDLTEEEAREILKLKRQNRAK